VNGVNIATLNAPAVYWFEAQGKDGAGNVTYRLNPSQVYVNPGVTSTYMLDLSQGS
jgi:hypothetical protein